MMTEEKQFYTMHEIANILTVDYNTVYRWIKAGKLKAVKLNSIVRVSKEAFNEFVNNGSKDVLEQSKRERFSIQGIFKGGGPISEEDINEAVKEWNKVKELQ
jgi:excisionase family DNA binding protein